MSYDILYRKAFIKIDENSIIPVYEAGSNNCTMRNNSGREVCARSWHNETHFTKGGLIISNNDLLNSIDHFRDNLNDENEEYNDGIFGYYSSVKISGRTESTFKSFKGYYSNGIKNSKTIEEYSTHNVEFSIGPYSYNEINITKLGLEVKPRVTLKSTEHMKSVIEEYINYYKDTDISCYITMENEWSFERMLANTKVKRVRKEKKDLEEFYTIVNLNDYYFVRFIKFGYKYSFHTPFKKFETEKKAEKFRSKMNSSNLFKVKFIAKR